MSLQEKLASLSQESAIKKAAADLEQQNKELEPVRAKIKELEKTKLDLEMLKNSLDFKNANKEDGLSMEEYKQVVVNEKKQSRQQLDDLFNKHQETVESLGIKKADDFLVHEEFANESESLVHKKALQQEDGLKLSDAELKKRLAGFGININESNFSYQTASQEVGKRLEALENELLSEKVKTPEGRQESVEKLSKEFYDNSKHLQLKSIVQNENKTQEGPNASLRLNISDQATGAYGEHVQINIFPDNAVVLNYKELKLLPKNYQEKVDKYGPEIVKEALVKNYEQKVEELQLSAGGEKMLSTLESISADKREQALESLNHFQKIQDKLLQMIKVKAEEFNLSPDYNAGYGASYKDIFKFDRYIDSQEIGNSLQPGRGLVPKYDFEKTKEIADKRSLELEQAIKIIEKIKSEEDFNNFSYKQTSDNYIGKLALQAFDTKFHSQAEFKVADDVNKEEFLRLAEQFPDHQQALNYLKQKLAKLEEISSKVKEKLAEVVDYEINLYNLKLKYGQNFSPGSLESMIEKIETEKEAANKALLLITQVETQLPSAELIVVNGTRVEISSILNEARENSTEKEAKELVLKEKKQNLSEKENKLNANPLFGKHKLKEAISSLKTEIIQLELEINELSDSSSNNLSLAIKNIKTDDLPWLSEAKSLVENFRASGVAGEVFTKLKKSLQSLADKEVPVEALELNKKFKNLEASLGKKN
jgi:hypothetical protein